CSLLAQRFSHISQSFIQGAGQPKWIMALSADCSIVLPSGELLAHDRLRLAEAFMLVEVNCPLIAGGDVELDDWLAYTLCPLAGAGKQRLGQAASAPGVVHVQGFDFDPLVVAPHA